MIYQLVKTSPLITGQVKLNLIVDNLANDSRTTVDNIYVSPISDNITHDIYTTDISNSHHTNLKILYDNIGSRIYSTETNTPLLSGNGIYIGNGCTVDTTYMSGTRRSTTHRFGKTFEYFMPMYIDDIQDIIKDDKRMLRFDFVVRSEAGNELIRRTIDLSDQVYGYITNIFSNIDDDMMFVSYSHDNAYIHGINIESGDDTMINIPQLIPDILSRERMLIEFDNMLIRKFQENNLISRQMINLCFHFDIDDIILNTYRDTMLFERFNIYVDCLKYDSETDEYVTVDVRDIHSNYEHISRYRIDLQDMTTVRQYDASMNVLDYMDDSKSSDLMYMNKMIQSNFHFSYHDNSDIMFNAYNGFSPVFVNSNSGDTYDLSGFYCNQPDLRFPTYDKKQRNVEYIHFNDERLSFLEDSFANVAKHMNIYDMTHFDSDVSGVVWRSMIRYDNSQIFGKSMNSSYAAHVHDAHNTVPNISVNTVGMRGDDAMYVAIKITNAGKYMMSVVSCETDMDLSPLTFKRMQSLFMTEYDKIFRYIVPSDSKYTEMESVFDDIGEMRNDYSIYIFKVDVDEGLSHKKTKITERIRSNDGIHAYTGRDKDTIYAMFNTFGNMMSAYIEPSILKFTETLKSQLDEIPRYAPLMTARIGNMSTRNRTIPDEVIHTLGKRHTYIYRYDGKIIPQFISINDNEHFFNYIYRKINMQDVDDNTMNMFDYYSAINVEPNYKSIGYYSLEKKRLTEKYPFDDRSVLFERKYIKDNLVCFNDKSFELETDSEHLMSVYGTPILSDMIIEDMFVSHIRKYNINLTADDIMTYLWNMYSYSINFEQMMDEYVQVGDVHMYLYRITFTSK